MHPFPANFFGEEWTKPIPPIANRLMTNIDTALMEQIFDITKRKWKPDIHHHGEADNLGRRFKISERIMIFHLKTL